MNRPTSINSKRIITSVDSQINLRKSTDVHTSVYSLPKRTIDIIGSLVGLCIIFFLFIPIAIAIKLDSPGSILFRQTRCGLLGKTFCILKFRSMVANAEEIKGLVENQAVGPIFKNSKDPRITRVGQFLRKTSLDEFPQFWNVLKGDMSLVGTRPPTPDEVAQYSQLFWQRLNVKPGMTGEWQINGRSKVSNFEEIIELDLRYQKNWSIAYDIKIIFNTLILIFTKKHGAF